MRYCILMGSPRKNGNTAALLHPFMEELHSLGHETDLAYLYEKEISSCIACRVCQKDWTIFGCHFKDDVQDIFDRILQADAIVLASPMYSWYCTAPMKALLDRLVYGMNKFYGEHKGPSLWRGKKIALLTTCGYRPEKGCDLWEEGMKRYAKHSELHYLGNLAERHLGYQTVFMDEAKDMRARMYAQELHQQVQNSFSS